MDIVRFVKNWTLPISMITGALSYFIYVSIPQLTPTRPVVSELINYVQPALIFCMLFLTFCKVRPAQLKPKRWFLKLALFQGGLFTILGLFLAACPDTPYRLVTEGAMLCVICPTATACAVVTMRLGGDAAIVTTYTIFMNLLVSLLAPVVLPIAHPQAGISFLPAFYTIIHKVFPLLICPLLAAWFVRYTLPPLHQSLLKLKDLAFYLWAIALALAIAITCKSLMHTDGSLWDILGIALVSAICCIIQFAFGKYIGKKVGHKTEGGQMLGQKNTVFIIWLGYTFLSPATTIAGGCYSVWHNLMNTWQLYKKRKADELAAKKLS